MKKRLISMILLAAMVSSLTACGSSASSGGSSTAGTTASAEDPASDGTSNADLKADLTLGLPGGYSVTSEAIVNSFKEKYPNINLTIDEAPWNDFSKKISAQIAGGTAPDVWFQENATILGYGAMGAAENLAPYIEKDLIASDYADTLYAAKVGDNVWGVPHGVNAVALAYNKKVFTDAGVDFPTNDWTYQDMIDAATKLTQDTDGDGKTDIYGFLTGGSITIGWYPWVRSAGGRALDASLENAVFDDEKSVQGIQAWYDTVYKQKVSPTLTEQNDMGKSFTIFGNNKAAMMFLQYSEAAGQLNANFPDLEYDTVMIPKTFDGSERHVPYVANSWIVYSRAKDASKQAAWLWIQHYLAEDTQKTIAESGATLPVQKNALESVSSLTAKPVNKAAFTQGITEAGTTLDENATWSTWRLEAQPVFQMILNNEIDIAEGLAQIKTNVQKVLDEN